MGGVLNAVIIGFEELLSCLGDMLDYYRHCETGILLNNMFVQSG